MRPTHSVPNLLAVALALIVTYACSDDTSLLVAGPDVGAEDVLADVDPSDAADVVEADVEIDAPDDDVAPSDADPTDVDPSDVDPSDVDPSDTLGPDTAPDTDPDVAVTQDAADAASETGDDGGLRDEELIAALLEETLAGHSPLGYTAARDRMYPVGGIEEHGGRIECIYTGRTVVADGSRTPSTGCQRADGTPISCSFNTEHTWAKYHIRATHPEGTEEYDEAEGDIHHLFPSDEGVNSARWHFPFGPTACVQAGNCRVDEESELGLAPDSTGSPACPTGNLDLDRDCNMLVRLDRRGDVARAQFYMAVRYTMPIPDDSEAAMRQWHAEDPPDQRERDRNDGVEDAQGNRNPFVDRPELVERIANF